MKKLRISHLGYPALLWFLLFLVGPVVLVSVTSFLKRGVYGGLDFQWGLGSYSRIFSGVYLEILWQTLKLSGFTTFLCLILGFPLAWAMATATIRLRMLAVLLISVPFLMNLIIRIYALRLMAGFDGPLLAFLRWLDWPHDPYAFSQNQGLVLFGMVTTYLPFMVFPLFAALEKFDFSQIEACADLGGSDFDVLFRVLIPNTRAAIANGCLMVFVPTFGEFVIPDLLGGAKNMLVGSLITEQFLKSRDWPFGSALSLVLILSLTLVALGLSRGNSRPRSGAAWKS